MRLPFFRRANHVKRLPAQWDLSTPLLHWSPEDPWTIGDAVTGTLTTGATGSGKTSGSGRAIALALLRAGFGGIVLTAKPDERALWEAYCRLSGRSASLKVFDVGAAQRFNFLDYEGTHRGDAAGLTENLVTYFSLVLEVADRGSGGGREDESYWKRATRQLLRNAIDLLTLSRRRITVPDLHRVVLSAPTSSAQKRSADWQAQSLCYQCLSEADKRAKSPREESDLGVVADYWLLEFPELSEKTRSVVVSSFTSMADVLMRGLLRDLFCTTTNLTPEETTNGAVIVIDLPVKVFGESGVFAQVLWKTAFQRAIERRDIAKNPRPVFLWMDEGQLFTTSNDAMFQSTCRSSRVATVFLTQNCSSVYAALGGQEKGKVEAQALFANLNTKILHANGDHITNEWASTMIGMSRQFMINGGSSRQGEGGWPFALGIESLTQSSNVSSGFSESWQPEVQPSAFTQLRTGGPANNREVDGILFQNGRRFRATGKTWLPLTFKQEK